MTSPDEPLADQTAATPGQPSTVRVGTVQAINPIQILMGGTVIDRDSLGFLTDYNPVVGDTVAILGQAVEGANSSASTWLVLGAINAAAPSRRPELQILAMTQRAAQFDSPTYTVAAGEQLIGGNITLTVPLKAGHIIGLHATWHHANTSGVAALTVVRFRENNLAGAQVAGKDYVPGVGNAYYGGRLDAWIRPTVTQNQLYVITTQAGVAGTGQWGMSPSDAFFAVDHGPAYAFPLV
jgi:hypothetical protein